MNNKGFTLVEILAVLIVLGILLVITIPIYQTVLAEVKRSDYNSKVTQIETAANKYAETIKDEIKEAWDKSGTEELAGNCKDTSVSDLIEKGLLLSETEAENVIYNPTNGKPLDKTIKMCYCANSYEIKSYYLEDFDESKLYYAGEKFVYGNKVYQVDYDYNPNISKLIDEDLKSKKINTDSELLKKYCSNCGRLTDLTNQTKKGIESICYNRNEKKATLVKSGKCFSELTC